MYAILIPFALLIALVLIKKIPVIGGNVPAALLIAGAAVMVLSGHAAPADWLAAVYDGLNRFAWVICLCLFVNIYAQAQIKLGTIGGVFRMLKSVFGSSERSLLFATVLALVFCGAFTGSTYACLTVVGMLVAKSLYDCGLSAEKVTATIVMGAMLGSLMPPISSSFFTSSALSGVDVSDTLNYGYLVIGLAVIFTTLYVVFILGKIKRDDHTFVMDREKLGDIWRECRAKMMPLFVLIAIIVLKQCLNINIMALTVGKLLSPLSKIPVVSSVIGNWLVLGFMVVALLSFVYPDVNKNVKEVMVNTYKTAKFSIFVMLSAAFMVGAFSITGGIDLVADAASKLNPNLLIWGGSLAMAAMGMITGGDTSALNTVFPFFFPAMMSLGRDAVRVTVAGSLISVAGEGLPPADVLVFVACSILATVLGVKKINPMKVMVLIMPLCLFLFAEGIIFLYI